MAKRGTAIAPMILGIIGSLVSLPGLLCASACGAMMSLGGGALGGAFFLVGFIPVVVGFISAFFSKSNPVIAGAGLLTSAVFSFIVLVMTGLTSLFAWAALILFIVGGILAFTQKMEDDPDVKPQEQRASPGRVLPPASTPLPRSDTGGRVCGKCNAINQPMNKFCHKCGNTLAEIRNEYSGTQGKVCPQCRFINTLVNKFCVKCGSTLIEKQPEAGRIPQRPQPPAPPVNPPVPAQMSRNESDDAKDVTMPFEETISAPVKTPDPASITVVKPEPASIPVKPEKAPEPARVQPPPAYNLPENAPPAPLKGWRPLGIEDNSEDNSDEDK